MTPLFPARSRPPFPLLFLSLPLFRSSSSLYALSLLTYLTLASYLLHTWNDPEKVNQPLICRRGPCTQLILAHLAGASPVGLAELKCVLVLGSPFSLTFEALTE
jgi:hypothetical protein